jgi:hypothetical protein
MGALDGCQSHIQKCVRQIENAGRSQLHAVCTSTAGALDEWDAHESGDGIESGVEGRNRAYASFPLQNDDEGVIEVELAASRSHQIEDAVVESLGFRAHPYDGRGIDPPSEASEHGSQIATPATLTKTTTEHGYGFADQNIE